MDEKDLRIQQLKADNKKLTEELEKYKQMEEKMHEKFQGHINTELIVNSFITFYDMQEVNEELAECLLLTNENAKKYKEYKQLEEQGLVRRLPCKIGDEIWLVGYRAKLKYIVSGFLIDRHGVMLRLDTKGIVQSRFIESDQVGETAFWTEQEAQSALEKMKGE